MVDIFTTQNKYDIIYADPAWSYYNDATVTDLEHYYNVPSKIRTPYPVMSVKDICALPIKNIAADNCILFMWVTDYHLGRAITEVIPAWGFEYKTVGFVWAKKTKEGKQASFMGNYTKKSGCELCLIATRGKDAHKMVINHRVNSFIEYPKSQHSKKPDIVRDSIVELVGDRPRIELFARDNFDGWDVWGNDKKLFE